MFPWIAAVLLGAVVPALCYGAVMPNWRFLQLAFIVTLAHAIILGLPVALFYRAKRWTRLSGVVLGALLIGVIPITFISLLPPPARSWDGYFSSLAVCAVLGAIGGFAFWLTLKSCGLLALSDQGVAAPTLGQRRLGILLAIAAVTTSVAVFAFG